MGAKYISIPFFGELTQEKGWSHDGEQACRFYVARMHFALRERHLCEETKLGTEIAAFQVDAGVGLENVNVIEEEHTETALEESIRNLLVEDEVLLSLASTFGTKFAASPSEISSNFKAEAQHRVKASYSNSHKTHQAITNRTKRTHTVKININSADGLPKKFIMAKEYKRCACDVWLAFVDYLFVDYRRSFFGLRKKRRKEPNPNLIKNGVHPNVIKVNLPLFTIFHWKLVPNGQSIVEQSRYKLEVEDPSSITVVPMAEEHSHARQFVMMPRVPTLYQLASAAFPLKWIHRTGPWSEEELMKIEEDEAKSTPWWMRHGSGAKSSQKS